MSSGRLASNRLEEFPVDFIGCIVATDSSGNIGLARWAEVVGEHPNLVQPEPRQGINPFTKEPMTIRAKAGHADVVIDGIKVGAMNWGKRGANMIQVFGDAVSIGPIALAVTDTLGGRYDPDAPWVERRQRVLPSAEPSSDPSGVAKEAWGMPERRDLNAQTPRPLFSAIRHLAAPYDGPRIIGAEFDSTVHVWDLKTRVPVAMFETALDFGGRRITINPQGDRCVVGSYERGGLTCHATDSGEVAYLRDDLKKPQQVTYSPDGRLLYCGVEQGPLAVLDAVTGADVAKYASTDKVFCSPHEPVEILSKRGDGGVELRSVGGARIAEAKRVTFGILDIAFGLDRLCMSESGGPVRCLGTATGIEIWRYTPEPGRHVLRLTFAPRASAFFGVEWLYAKGGPKRLLRFDPETGVASLVATIRKPSATEVFCSRGEILLTSEGESIDVLSGDAKEPFSFPAEKARG